MYPCIGLYVGLKYIIGSPRYCMELQYYIFSDFRHLRGVTGGMVHTESIDDDQPLIIVQIGDYLVWKNFHALEDSDMVCFYDGDLSQVLSMGEYLTCPDNPTPRTFAHPFKFRSVTAECLDWVTPVEPLAI